MKVFYRIIYAFTCFLLIILLEFVQSLPPPKAAAESISEHEPRSVKKELKLNNRVPTALPVASGAPPQPPQQSQLENNEITENKTEKIVNLHNTIGRPNNDYEIPDSFRIGFYIFIGLGLLAIFYIIFRSYRLRLSRAERRYGVHGDRSTQELTPLPIAIEDDSETEDQTIFEINRQARIS